MSRRKKLISDKIRMWIDGDKRCGICLKPINSLGEANVDHIIPLSRGGTHAIENLQLAHIKCNSQKKSWILPIIIDRRKLLNRIKDGSHE